MCIGKLLHRLLCLIFVNKSLYVKFAPTLKWILLSSFWGNVLLGGELQIDSKQFKFEINFGSALYVKSGSMPFNDKSKNQWKYFSHTFFFFLFICLTMI